MGRSHQQVGIEPDRRGAGNALSRKTQTFRERPANPCFQGRSSRISAVLPNGIIWGGYSPRLAVVARTRPDADPRHRHHRRDRRRRWPPACRRTATTCPRAGPRPVARGRGGRAGHPRARAATRSPARGLAEALDGVDVAYYLIHSMEPSADGFAARDRTAAIDVPRRGPRRGRAPRRLPRRARAARARRLAASGQPPGGRAHPAATRRPSRVALRASIVDLGHAAARSASSCTSSSACRSCRCPPGATSAPSRSTAATCSRFSSARGTGDAAAGRTLDIAGPDVLTYGEMVLRIADAMGVGRPPLRLGFIATAADLARGGRRRRRGARADRAR